MIESGATDFASQECSDGWDRAALTDVWISDECVLTAFAPYTALFTHSNEPGIWEITRIPEP